MAAPLLHPSLWKVEVERVRSLGLVWVTCKQTNKVNNSRRPVGVVYFIIPPPERLRQEDYEF